MLITIVNKTFYEKRMIEEASHGTFHKTKPLVDRQKYNIYKYKTALFVVFNKDDLLALNRPITYENIFDIINKQNKDYKLNVNDNYIYHKNTFIFYNDLTKGIYILNYNDAIKIIELTDKEKNLIEHNEYIENKKKIINNFIIPYLEPILDKHGLCIYKDDDDGTAKIYFNSSKDFANFVIKSLMEKIEDDCKAIGIDLRSGIMADLNGFYCPTPIASLYDCNICLPSDK